MSASTEMRDELDDSRQRRNELDVEREAAEAMSKKLAEALVELARDMPACEHESVPLVCRYCQTRAALADYSKEQP